MRPSPVPTRVRARCRRPLGTRRRRRCSAATRSGAPGSAAPARALRRACRRVRHRGVDATHPCLPGTAALTASDGLVVDPPVAPDQHVVHRPLPRRADAAGDGELEAPRHTSATRWLTSTFPAPTAPGARGDDAARGRDHVDGPHRATVGGDRGVGHRRRANETALTVTASTALTLPGRCAPVPVKSNVARSPSTVSVTTTDVGDCCSDAGRRSRARPRSGTAVGQRSQRRASALAVVDDLGERLVGRGSPRARRDGRRRVGSRLAGVEVAASLFGVRELATTISATSRVSRTGGMRRPSCWMSTASGGIDPGAMPPRSAWWARFGPADELVVNEARRHDVTSFRCVPPAYGSFRTTWSPGRSVAERIESGARTRASIRGAQECARPGRGARRRR